jgi:hypothetical protein
MANGVEKIRTQIFCSITFFQKIRVVYEIRWKIIVQQGRPHMTTWRMRIACWIPKATNIHTGCAIFIDYPLHQWLLKPASLLHYTYFTQFVTFNVYQLCAIILLWGPNDP